MDEPGAAGQAVAHLDAPNAELYRRVIGVFVTAKRGFLVHLRPDDLASSLGEAGGTPVDLAAVEAASKQFEQWLNLRADPDTSRVTTVDDFYRPRYLYQLTAEGEAAEVALAAYDGRWAPGCRPRVGRSEIRAIPGPMGIPDCRP